MSEENVCLIIISKYYMAAVFSDLPVCEYHIVRVYLSASFFANTPERVGLGITSTDASLLETQHAQERLCK